MKTDDYEKLKKLCDDNGFELVTESPNENDKFFVVKKKPERVEVTFSKSYMSVGEFYFEVFLENGKKIYGQENSNKIGIFLTQKLEEFINNELL